MGLSLVYLTSSTRFSSFPNPVLTFKVGNSSKLQWQVVRADTGHRKRASGPGAGPGSAINQYTLTTEGIKPSRGI